MHLADFCYDLPSELIAQTPAEPRDSARLFVYNRASDSISHATVRDLAQFLPAETAVVVNNSKVRKARHYARHQENGKTYEIFVLEPRPTAGSFSCMVRGSAPKIGDSFLITTPTGDVTALHATVESIESSSAMTTFTLVFTGVESIDEALEATGEIPLPPYITERGSSDERYQTIYAGPIGSSAAPTAGLHITPELQLGLRDAGHSWHEVTLHVGLGTFLPLRADTIEDNQLHTEITTIEDTTAATLSRAITENKSILAVGTTSLRTLEGHWQGSKLLAGTQPTNIFLHPGKQIATANHLLTNFHLPESSLLVLIATFISHSSDRQITLSPQEAIARTQQLYAEAISQRYRFFSFGDAMLIL